LALLKQNKSDFECHTGVEDKESLKLKVVGYVKQQPISRIFMYICSLLCWLFIVDKSERIKNKSTRNWIRLNSKLTS